MTYELNDRAKQALQRSTNASILDLQKMDLEDEVRFVEDSIKNL